MSRSVGTMTHPRHPKNWNKEEIRKFLRPKVGNTITKIFGRPSLPNSEMEFRRYRSVTDHTNRDPSRFNYFPER